MTRTDRPQFSRRGLLLAGAGGLVAAACGSSGSSERASSSTTVAPVPLGLSLAPVFLTQQPAGVEVRLPLALGDATGVLVGDPPSSMSVRMGNADTGELGDPMVVERHDQSIPRPYFPLTTTFPEPGNWRLATEIEGKPAEIVVTALGPADLPYTVPVVGEQLISLPTPTVDNAQGVDPICTDDPPCPLHATSLDTAIAADKAIALLIATPAYCQTAICGPVLDLLVARQAQFADVITMIHAEVYPNEAQAGRTTTDVVTAYGLPWEPSLFLALPDGTITNRLDYTYDDRELDEALSALIQ